MIALFLEKFMAIVDAVISLLKEGHEEFDLADQGSIDKYLGLLIWDINSITFKMSQPFLIRHILDFLLLDENKTNRARHSNWKAITQSWSGWCSSKAHVAISRRSWYVCYVANSFQPEIQMAVHQTARFSIKPMRLHELAIMWIGRYLCNNPDGGIIYNVDRSKGLEVYADVDFAGGWSVADSDNADNILS